MLKFDHWWYERSRFCDGETVVNRVQKIKGRLMRQ